MTELAEIQLELPITIYDIERAMMLRPQVEIPIKEYFSYGVYAREMTVPKGARWTGKIHKYANMNTLSQGEMSVLIENRIERIKAPFTFVAPAGSKRIGYAHEECVWTTFLGTAQTDPEIIEAHFTADSHEDYLRFTAQIGA